MFRFLLVFFVFSFPVLAHELDYSWLIRSDYHNLNMIVMSDEECPIGESDLEKIISDEFSRARITYNERANFYLVLEVTCSEIGFKDGSTYGTLAHADIYFSTAIRGVPIAFIFPNEKSHMATNGGELDHVSNGLRKNIYDILNVYLTVNKD